MNATKVSKPIIYINSYTFRSSSTHPYDLCVDDEYKTCPICGEREYWDAAYHSELCDTIKELKNTVEKLKEKLEDVYILSLNVQADLEILERR